MSEAVTETETKAALVPPSNPPRVATEWPEFIRDLGDQIARLSGVERLAVAEYLKDRYGIDSMTGPQARATREGKPK